MVITERDYDKLVDYVKGNYGINLKEKKIMVMTRLQSLLNEKKIEKFSDYINILVEDRTGEQLSLLLDRITTNYTYFMREEDHFNYLSKEVLPYFASTVRDRDFRIWSAGCSSGEEAYTLAMLLDNYSDLLKGVWDKKVLATDISSKVLNIATIGIYNVKQLDILPASWKIKYLNKIGEDKYEVKESIKKEVIFRRFNLMNEFLFKKKFHVIFCRNVMIYFDSATKEDLVKRFYNILEDGGFLFIGQSESIGDNKKFKYIMPSVYRKVL